MLREITLTIRVWVFVLFGLCAIALLILKLFDVLGWAWEWVLSPLWIWGALVLIMAMLVCFLVACKPEYRR